MGEEPVSGPLGRIALVGTGGTISAWSPATLDLTGYTEAEDQRLTLAELVAAVPDLERVAEVVQIPAEAGPSHALDLAGLLGVAAEVRRARERPGVRGVVVAHGTNTLEELAFLLDLVLGPGTPVVLTAAMRPLSALSGDGPLNLVNAARVALCPAAAGRGALVVVDDAIWSARRVAKTGTAGTGAFGGLGPLGEVDPGGQVRFRFAEEHSAPILPVTETTPVPRVDVVVSYPGADGALIDAAVAAGARGLVSAGTGRGSRPRPRLRRCGARPRRAWWSASPTGARRAVSGPAPGWRRRVRGRAGPLAVQVPGAARPGLGRRRRPRRDPGPVRHVRREMRANRGIVFTLGGLAAISPLSGDMYLAAFPAIATDLNASVTQVQLTLTASLLGLSSGQLVIGPLSDLWGRRPPLLTGIILYVLASLGCAFAGSIELLIALRFCQGFAGAAAVVLSRAMVRDLYTGTAAVRVFSQMMAVFGVAPVIAPVIGSALLTVGNWCAIFLVLAGAGALQLLAVLTTLGETLPPERRQSGGLRRIPGLVRAVFSDPPFLGAALSCGFAFGAMFAYIAASPSCSRRCTARPPWSTAGSSRSTRPG